MADADGTGADGDAVDDAGDEDAAGSAAEAAGAAVVATGLDGAVDAGVDGATVGADDVVDVAEGAALAGVVGEAVLDGVVGEAVLEGVAACVVAVDGLGVGDVVFGCGEDTDGDGRADELVGDDPEAGCPGDDAGDVEAGTLSFTNGGTGADDGAAKLPAAAGGGLVKRRAASRRTGCPSLRPGSPSVVPPACGAAVPLVSPLLTACGDGAGELCVP